MLPHYPEVLSPLNLLKGTPFAGLLDEETLVALAACCSIVKLEPNSMLLRSPGAVYVVGDGVINLGVYMKTEHRHEFGLVTSKMRGDVLAESNSSNPTEQPNASLADIGNTRRSWYLCGRALRRSFSTFTGSFGSHTPRGSSTWKKRDGSFRNSTCNRMSNAVSVISRSGAVLLKLDLAKTNTFFSLMQTGSTPASAAAAATCNGAANLPLSSPVQDKAECPPTPLPNAAGSEVPTRSSITRRPRASTEGNVQIVKSMLGHPAKQYFADARYVRSLAICRLHLLSELAQFEIHAPEKILIRAGEIPNKFFVVVHGLLQVNRTDESADFIKAGDVIGVVPALTNVPQPFVVRTVEQCVLLSLEREVVFKLTDAFGDVRIDIGRLVRLIMIGDVLERIHNTGPAQQVVWDERAAEFVLTTCCPHPGRQTQSSCPPRHIRCRRL